MHKHATQKYTRTHWRLPAMWLCLKHLSWRQSSGIFCFFLLYIYIYSTPACGCECTCGFKCVGFWLSFHSWMPNTQVFIFVHSSTDDTHTYVCVCPDSQTLFQASPNWKLALQMKVPAERLWWELTSRQRCVLCKWCLCVSLIPDDQ